MYDWAHGESKREPYRLSERGFALFLFFFVAKGGLSEARQKESQLPLFRNSKHPDSQSGGYLVTREADKFLIISATPPYAHGVSNLLPTPSMQSNIQASY
jgi:hypothetical protein